MGRETVTRDRDLARRVCGLTAGFAVAVAGACGLAWGVAEAAGALVGTAITMANFAGLEWAAGRVMRGVAGGSTPGVRPGLWLGASGARLLLVGLAFGGVAALGWVGLRGLLVSLTILPGVVVGVGLRAARVA